MITKKSRFGDVVDNGDGTWSWSLATTDDGSGTVVVKADDGDGGVTESTFTYTASDVKPVLSSVAATNTSGTATTGGDVVNLSFTAAAGSTEVVSGTINWGDGVTESFSGGSIQASHKYAAGNYTITITGRDDDDNTVTATQSVSKLYKMSAILDPIKADSVFKSGSTIPVKVRITDSTGAAVPDLAPTIRTGLHSTTTPSTAINEPLSSSTADTTGVLRFDAGSGQYIYNLASKSLGSDQDAKYRLVVASTQATTGTTSTAQSAEAVIGLRTK